MRSQSFLRKSHSLIKGSAVLHDLSPFLQARAPNFPRNKRLRSISSSLIPNRRLSTSTPTDPIEGSSFTSAAQDEPPPADPPVNTPSIPAAVEEPDKGTPKPRRTRITSSARDVDSLELPEGLEGEILYVPSESLLQASNSGLPPPEIFEEALDKLLIALHPKNQSRATIPNRGSNRSVEPTLGLYCPIEGGNYVVDVTVHELAYQTGAEVLIVDAIQLAAGEWGQFGKAADALNLPRNPLHFSSPSPPSPESTQQPFPEEDGHETGQPVLFPPAQMSISLPKALSSMTTRGLVSSTAARKPASPSKLELFFEALVNIPSPPESEDSSSTVTKNRPRLIYIRDFPTLASSSSSWYPALLDAVRNRRRGLLARASNVSSSPVAIVFGMTPSITPLNEGSSGPTTNLINILMTLSAASSQVPAAAKGEQCHDWSESEAAEHAREKRLRSRLKKWEKNPAALHNDFPRLHDGGQESPEIIFLGGDPKASSPSSGSGLLIGVPTSNDDQGAQFFRSAILVPATRSTAVERESRVTRRREINELTIRMGIGAVGGVIESSPFEASEPPTRKDEEETHGRRFKVTSPMWDDWGNKLEPWSNVRKIADRAIGSVMLSKLAGNAPEKQTLASTTVPWPAVEAAWIACNALGTTRRIWLKEAFGKTASDDLEEALLNGAGSSSDKVVESIKNDPDLDPHEGRLLSCIVDANSMTTTFGQVHLPGHTIDAVRTIVSLPLLHPHAFQQGILKEHSMTGCLLFGPPGTGKTLVVRALAKEAGCRMLAISPSDVMDMYVGEGEKLVRAVFSLARKLSPCVVFLDEIDALFGARMSARENGSAFAHRGVITEFMQEMDGLKSNNEDNVIVIGATNRPFDLDDAVLRRLPRRLLVDLPGEKERAEILKILLRDEEMASDVHIDALAKRTEGFSGSDLKHLCVSAALDSVKEHMELPWLSRHGTQPAPTQTPDSAPEGGITPKTSSAKTAESVGDDSLKDDAAVVETSSATEESTSGSVPADASTADSSSVAEPSSSIHEEPSRDSTPSNASSTADDAQAAEPPKQERVLHLRHFTQALKEITPSSSETLGSLTDLRKWNEEFGEGRRDKKKRQVWGKGRFGFINGLNDIVEDGRVAK